MEPLSLLSREEEDHFFKMIQQKDTVPYSRYHVGGLLVDGEWKWKSDLSNISSHMKWAIGQPNNNLGNEKCLSIRKSTSDLGTGFNDINCEIPKGFFCQRPENPKISKAREETTTETQAVL